MVELEGMIDYCTKPRCRRKHVLEHFGEQFDPKTQCKTTSLPCDFCKNPEKVEADTKAAECMSAVVKSQRMMQAGNHGHRRDEKPFHRTPLDSDASHDDEYESDGFGGNDDGLFGATDYVGEDNYAKNQLKMNGFVKASIVMHKYEVSLCVTLVIGKLIF
jgi:hypothetical protein